ncbi:MAG: HEAT repeat domain-containing protein [Planctomycetota bacterium]|jgi:hypothetical protein
MINVARSVLVAALCLAAAPAVAQDRETKSGADATEQIEQLGKQLKSKDVSERREAATKALEHGSKELTSGLARCLKDKDLTVRVSAAKALAVREDESARRTAAKALAARLPSIPAGDDGWIEMESVLTALHDLARPETVKPIVDGIDYETEADEIKLRLMAIANVAHPTAIDSLIRIGSSGHKRRGDGKNWGRAIVTALQYATGHDLKAQDPDLWRAWWKDAKKTFDFEAAAADRAAERQAKKDKALAAEEKKRKREENKRKKEERKKERRKKKRTDDS